MNWEQWIQQTAGKGLDALISKKVTQPYNLKAMQLQAYGDYGYYQEGQPGAIDPKTGLPVKSGLGIPPVLLIGGAMLLAFVLVKA